MADRVRNFLDFRSETEKQQQEAHSTISEIVEHLIHEVLRNGIKRTHTENPRFFFKNPIRPVDLEAMATLPLEIIVTNFGGKYLVEVGTADSVRCSNPSGHFELHNHIGDAPDVSPDDVRWSRIRKRVSLIISRYGITIITPDTSPSDFAIASRKDEWSMVRGHRHKIEQRQREKGVTAGYVHFTDKAKVQLVCDFLNGVVKWEDIAVAVRD